MINNFTPLLMATDYTLQTRLRFDLSGNVGIGTTQPQSKLDVRGAVSATSLSGTLNWTDVSGAPPYELPPGSILVYDASMNIDSSFILADGSTVNRADYPELADVLGIPFNQATFQLPNPALENQVDWDVSNNNIQTFIKNKPNIYKDTSNNVVSGSHLIPSTNVTYDLGTPEYRWKDIYLSGNTIDISGTRLSRHTDGSLMVHDINGNYMTGRFNHVTTTGNIGVGTNNPIYKMHVIGDTRIQGDLTVNGTQTVVNTDIQVTDQVVITNNGTGPALVVTQSGVETIADFCDETSGNIVMRIADGGNVGIGTSNPQAKLHLANNSNNNLLNVEHNINNQEFPPTAMSQTTFTPDYTDTITSIDSVLYGLFEYPPLPNPLTGSSTSISGAMYGNGTYVVSASSTNSTYYPYLAFDKNPYSTSQWQSASNTYNTTAPYAAVAGVNTTVSGTTYTGSWIQIQLPSSIIVKQYSLTHFYVGSGEALPPSEWVLAGSTDASTWSLLNFTTFSMNTDSVYTVDISSNTSSFSYYRVIITKIIGNNNRAALSEIRLYANATATVPAGGLEFPPIPLTNYSTTLNSTYGAGTYTVSSSSIYISTNSYVPWKAFNKQLTSDLQAWYAGDKVYNTSSGNYQGLINTFVSGTYYFGEWLQIDLPKPIILKSYQIAITNTGWTLQKWYIMGSVDKVNWVLVDNQTQTSPQTGWTANAFRTFNVNTNTACSSYRIIVNVAGGNTSFHIGEWKLFGDITTRLPKYKSYLNSSISTYGSGLYTIFTNTLSGITTINESNPSQLINKNLSEWSTGNTIYTNSSDASTTPIIHLYLPSSIVVKSYTIRGSSVIAKSPNKWNLYGYNGSSWVLIDSENGITWTSNEVKTFDLSNNLMYYANYYIELLRNNSSTGDQIAMSEFYFNGNDTESRLVVNNNGRLGVNTNVSDTNIININGNSQISGNVNITDTVVVSGNVGIGTSMPLSKLHVNGSIYSPGGIINTVITSYAIPAGHLTTTSNIATATNLKITIQPKFATSKILLHFSIHMMYIAGDNGGRIHIFRGIDNATPTQLTTGYGAYFQPNSGGTSAYIPVSFLYDDIPNTTTSVTYELYISSDSNTITFGFHQGSRVVIMAQEICV
jgi:hypothetical protein